jgi:nitroreductase
MAREIDTELNRQLDKVIAERRTIRSFTEEAPPKEHVEQVLRAGLLAPYASVAVGDYKLFRRFFVMNKGGKAVTELAGIIKAGIIAAVRAMLDNIPEGAEPPPFAMRLKSVAEGGEIGFESVPCFVVVAEKRGMPPAELQSLAHVMENMWLKATALGMGFRLISAVSQQSDNPDFCKLLGLTPGEFALVGCALGYATEWPPATDRPPLDEVTAWLD